MRILALLALFACKKDTTPAPAPQPMAAETIEIVKGPLDQREYAYVKLDNGLQAILIHDPDTDMAAAALDVHVGHYADPDDREGLAHFLEHMLFMGTDKYPEVDDYRNFIQAHGGWSNAGTGGESTGYYFQVEQAHLHEAFKRFSRFFVAPKLDPEYVDRERNAVNSEYSLKVQDHARRIREVRKATMNPAHPESKFSVGNLGTLDDRGEDTVHARLLELYAEEYRPDRMTVAVIGREPVSELKSWVVEELSQVKGEPKPRGERPPPFLPEQLGVRIDMEALDERRLLELQFPAKDQHGFFPKRPHDFVFGVLGHEGEGTLFAELKAKGWIESLNASTGDGADDYDLLVLGYELTKEGANHIDEIVTASFDAIEKLRDEGLEAWRHAENEKMAELGFKFAEETPVVNAVNLVTWSMSWAPPEHALDFWAVPTDFDPELVKNETLAKMTPENLRMVVTLPEGEGDANLDQLEERYQVKYGMRKLNAAELETYAGDAGLDVKLPAQNPYLPESIAVKPGADAPGKPQELQVGGIKVWHLQDGSFGVPRATTHVRVFSKAPRKNGIQSRVKGYLYEMLIEDALQEFAYPVREAGLQTNVNVPSWGLALDIFGYDDRQGALLSDLSSKIRSLEVDPERFAIVKDRLARNWRNSKTQRPINQAAWALGEAMDPNDWSVDAMLPVLEKITVEQQKAFIDGFYTEAAAEMLVHGNLTADEAKGLASTVEGVLLKGSKPLASIKETRNTLPDAKEIVRNVVIDHNDSTIVVRYQDTATDLDTQARWRMLGQLVNTPFFTQLRTEQQLGYVVAGYYQSEDLLPGITLRIQSPVAGPKALETAVDTFLKDYAATLEAMPEEEFESIRTGLSARLRESRTQMQQKASDLKVDLQLGLTTFDRKVVLADRVDTLNKQEMLDLWQQVFLGDEGRLVIRSFGTAHDEKADSGCKDETCTQKAMGPVYERELLGG